MKRYTKIPALMLSVMLMLVSCDKEDDLETAIHYGPETVIGDGTARAWVQTTPDKKPLAIGLSISKKIIKSLPKEMIEYKLDLPEGLDIAPYDHVVLDWNPMGHPPATYETPHFDMHFYMIPDAERKAIPAGPQEHAAAFEESYMPSTYFSQVEAVPAMGVHWLSIYSPELNGHHFTQTYIVGANNDKIIFYEPMITLAYLQGLDKGQKNVFKVDQATKVQRDGYHPLSYTIYNSSDEDEYVVSLTDLKFRKGE
ncbi:DUF5602 domain-containing protein [Pontibacter rugosus]|uniref:DUF5602 domain-containing protein n=1 Tax=Pontibacter rugosus TaxID=1745966 RepID=A0ABW3SXF1_9BACT